MKGDSTNRFSSHKFQQIIYRTPSDDWFRHFLNVDKVYAKSDFTLTWRYISLVLYICDSYNFTVDLGHMFLDKIN